MRRKQLNPLSPVYLDFEAELAKCAPGQPIEPLREGEQLLDWRVQTVQPDQLVLVRRQSLASARLTRLCFLILFPLISAFIPIALLGQEFGIEFGLTAGGLALCLSFVVFFPFTHQIEISRTAAKGEPGIAFHRHRWIFSPYVKPIPFARIAELKAIMFDPSRGPRGVNVMVIDVRGKQLRMSQALVTQKNLLSTARLLKTVTDLRSALTIQERRDNKAGSAKVVTH